MKKKLTQKKKAKKANTNGYTDCTLGRSPRYPKTNYLRIAYVRGYREAKQNF